MSSKYMMISLILIGIEVSQAAAWGAKRSMKESNASEESLFSATGYPEFGDIPLLNRKVFKGSRAVATEYPYVASIRRNYSHYLTAAILTTNLVVTVAHPLFHVPNYELGVVVGESYSDRGTSILTVLLVVIHQHFDPWTLKHDLALLRVFENFNNKLNVKPISLVNRQYDSLDGSTGFVAGWGRCDFQPSDLCLPRSSAYYPNELQDPMLRSISFKLRTPTPYCNEYELQGVAIHTGMVCQGLARNADVVAPCLAVPGAPLAVRGRLVGLQSWGFGCGYVGDLPLVYTDLTRYQNWLYTNLHVMANMTQSELRLLFEATKSFMLREVMYMTRKYPSLEHSHSDLTMEPLSLDSKLALLKGKVYDLRDFLGKRFHEEKKEMYRILKLKIQDSLLQSQPPNSSSTEAVEGSSQAPSGGYSDSADSDYYQELAANAEFLQGLNYDETEMLLEVQLEQNLIVILAGFMLSGFLLTMRFTRVFCRLLKICSCAK